MELHNFAVQNLQPKCSALQKSTHGARQAARLSSTKTYLEGNSKIDGYRGKCSDRHRLPRKPQPILYTSFAQKALKLYIFPQKAFEL